MVENPQVPPVDGAYLEHLASMIGLPDDKHTEFIEAMSEWWRVVSVHYLPDAEATPTPFGLASELDALAQTATALAKGVSGLSSDAWAYLATMAIPKHERLARRRDNDREVDLVFLGNENLGQLTESLQTGTRTLAELSTMAAQAIREDGVGRKHRDDIIDARRQAIRELFVIYRDFTGDTPTSTPEGKFFLFASTALEPIFEEDLAQAIESDLLKIVGEFRRRVPPK